MFHTFSAAKEATSTAASASSRRKTNSVRACDECRRRKIRCDGQRPCESCLWYQRSHLCRYQDPHPHDRQAASACERIVQKLFPSKKSTGELSSLADLSAIELLHLAKSELVPDCPASSRAISPPSETQVSPSSEASGDLTTLQMMPEEELGDQRDTDNQDTISNFSDDVNALALSSKPPSSYLGASSIAATLKVITWLHPEFPSRVGFTASSDPVQYSSTLRSIIMKIRDEQREVVVDPAHYLHTNENYLIDSFFRYFHPNAPLLDEVAFRDTYVKRQRSDSRWLSLLNIVLALGSISITPADNKAHYVYFQRSKGYINLSYLSRPHIETIQTLGLMGGLYLHYISQPNLAYSLMGTALRMATSLGLHKEFPLHDDSRIRNHATTIDTRRRVWWSLICLDTWGTETLGRPSLGRWSAGITAKLPHCSAGNDHFFAVLPLIESVRYCRITTQIHEAMAVVPLLAYKDMKNLDQQLIQWYENLPPLLKDFEPCPESLVMNRAILRWRYIVQRMHLYRPALLSYAMRRIPFAALRAEERSAVETCIDLAAEAIRDIGVFANHCSSQILGWRGVWFVFQAVMVPLMTLYIDDQTDSVLIRNSHDYIKSAIAILVRMQSWSPTGSRTLNCVCSLYETAIRLSSSDPTTAPIHTNAASLNAMHTPVSIQRHEEGSSFTPTQSVFDLNPNAFHPHSINTEDDMGDDIMWDFITWSDDRLAQSLIQLDTQMFPEEYALHTGISPPLHRDQGSGYNEAGYFG